jgi:hypothetical protein
MYFKKLIFKIKNRIENFPYKKDLLSVFVLVLIVCLSLVPTFVKSDFGGDFVDQTVPWNHFLFTNLRNGVIPFWSPYALLGLPFLFAPSLAFFHPLTQLILLLNFLFNFNSSSIEVTGKIIQYVFVVAFCIGGIGTYILSRKILGLSKLSALFAGVVFSLNPSWLHITHVVWMAWGFNSLPWIFLFLALFLSKPTFRLFFLVTFLNVLLFACGYPYYYVYFILAEILLVFFYGPKKMALFFLSLLNSVLLSSFFLLPYLNVMSQSGRAENIYDFTWHSFASLFPTSLLLILNPLTYSANIYKYPDVSQIFSGATLTWGTFVCMFLVYGLFQLKFKPIYRWAVIVFFVSLFYSFGSNLSTHSFFGTLLPIIYKFRSHNQMMSLTIFTGVLFIGLGLEAISRRIRVKYIDMAFWFICLSTFIGLTLGPVFFWSKIAITAEFFKGTTIMFLFLFSSLVLSALTIKFGKKSFLILGLLIVLIEYHYYLPSQPGYFSDNVTYGQFYKINATIPEFPSANNLFRIYFENHFGYNTSVINAYGLTGYENSVPPAYDQLKNIYGWSVRFWQVANVKYVVTAQNNLDTENFVQKIRTISPIEHPDQFVAFETSAPQYVYKIKDFLPRFYVPGKVEPCLDVNCWKKESAPELVIARGISGSMINPTSGTKIDVKEYNLNNIEMEINTPQETFIASSETYDKGWSLTVDSKPSTIYFTSNGLRGFIVPAGRSIVKMNYFPPYVIEGVALSIVGIFLLILIYFMYNQRINLITICEYVRFVKPKEKSL